MEINEKKLTDEETIQVLDECFAKVGVMSCEGCKVYSGNGLRDCMKHIGRLALDLIYRLQDEKQKVIQDYYAEKQTCDQQKDIIAKQKTEIERLKTENEGLKERGEIVINSLHQTIDKQKAEIERLTEWKDKLQDTKDELEQQLIDTGFKEYCEENKRLTDENAELQRQVDILTAEKENLYFLNKNLEDYIDNHEPIWKRNTEQAVKDTAKEIYCEIIEMEENPCNSREEIYQAVFGKRGVEVE